MKTTLLLITSLFCISAYAQFGPQQIISSTDKAYYSIPLDIDNDGYIDVLKATLDDYELLWHRNLDGTGNFGPEIYIDITSAFYTSIHFVDLDSDGDNDLLFHENNPRTISWIENLDGSGSFGPRTVILENQADFISSVSASDIDNDLDLDLIVTFTDTTFDTLVWYENLDGLANFGPANTILENQIEIFPPLLVDLDNDGDLDILTSNETTSSAAKLVWLKNLGNAVFDDETELHEFQFLLSDWTSIINIQSVDINTDQKDDIVITSHNDDTGTFNHWFENIDQQGNFGPIQSLPIYGNFSDMDNDGDNDILTGNNFTNRLYWVENSDGLGTYTTERTITTEVDFLRYYDTADFNGDGLLDVVSSSIGDNKVAWYENLGVAGISENLENTFVLFPNPTQTKITILSNTEVETIELYTSLGQKINSYSHTETIDVSTFASGIYTVHIIGVDGTSKTQKIVKQ